MAVSLNAKRRFLLLQARDRSDPIRRAEIDAFAWALGCEASQIAAANLVESPPAESAIAACDMVLIGGSGDYSAAGDPAETKWLDPALAILRRLYTLRKPAFGSCWGFQAFCRAMGGSCVHARERAELGPTQMRLTAAGAADPVFGTLPRTFLAHAGHEDRVDRLPPGATLLAGSKREAHQAIRFDAPIYATQFHPELSAETLLSRVEAYPRYVEAIAGISLAEFGARLRETPEANSLLRAAADLWLS